MEKGDKVDRKKAPQAPQGAQSLASPDAFRASVISLSSWALNVQQFEKTAAASSGPLVNMVSKLALLALVSQGVEDVQRALRRW